MMKTCILSGLAFIIMSNFSSCDLVFTNEPDMIIYKLDLSFQDASGNDLARGIGLDEWCCPGDMTEEQAPWGSVKRDLYMLKMIASQPCEDAMDAQNNRPGFIPDDNSPRLGMNRFDGFSYLTTDFILFAKDCPCEKVLTYKLKCPYVFGDEAEHEFVTYWEIPKMKNSCAYAKCTRLEFEGKVFTAIASPKEHSYKAIILLEGRDHAADRTE